MLFAVLIGLALHPLYESISLQPGVEWCSRPLLQIGVALLGFRVDLNALQAVGTAAPIMTIACLVLTIILGTMLARWIGLSSRFAMLVSGAVAICGVSAAVAISSVLPKSANSNRELALTVAGVTGMSTLAMIFYPLISQWLNHSDLESGIFIGASIHDVAQVVGAGYSISESAGDTATFIKLIRVSALLPVVIVIGLIFGRSRSASGESKPNLLPPFLIAYALIATINSFHLWPESVQTIGIEVSKFFLVISLVAIGLKTDLKDVAAVGKRPLIALLSTTVLMAVLIVVGITFLR